MRIAALYDIHGNLPALRAVLSEIRSLQVDQIVIGGDVLPGPMPVECLETLRLPDLPVTCIAGNGDREVLACCQGHTTEWFRTAPELWKMPVRWSSSRLSASLTEWIATWPQTVSIPVPRIGHVLFCHATPQNDTENITSDTPAELLAPILQDFHGTTVVCGHTHMPYDRIVSGVRLMNAGSVGMPFGAPGADWLLIDDDLQLRHTDYDLDGAAQQVLDTEYPQREAFARNSILNPPDAARMRTAFAQAIRSD